MHIRAREGIKTLVAGSDIRLTGVPVIVTAQILINARILTYPDSNNGAKR